MTVYRGRLVAGGEFVRAGDLQVNQVAAWTGSDWESLEGGVRHGGCPGPPCWPDVQELTTFDGELIAAGWFLEAGGRPANNIAAWDGKHWYPLGTGTNGRIYALLVHEGFLYVGGYFTEAGGYPARNLAQWNGVSWSWLGTGLDRTVYDLAAYDGKLVAVGGFDYAGEVRVNGIASWDGVSWSPMGQGAVQSASDVVVYNGELIVAGSFPDPDNPCCTYQLGRWDGAAWVPFTPRPNLWIVDLVVYRGDLVASSASVPGVIRWNGSEWSPLGSGMDDTPLILATDGVSLYAGGKFTTAGGKPSQFVARWHDVITPVRIEDLRAAVHDGQVVLTWSLSRESLQGLRTIHVQRSLDPGGPFEEVAEPLLPVASMVYVDPAPLQVDRAWYRLVSVPYAGDAEVAGPVEVVLGAPWSGSGRIVSARVSEDGGSVSIRFVVGRPGWVGLTVHDVRGRRLGVLEASVLPRGEHARTWDRIDRSGNRAPRGVYVLRLDASGRADSRKVVLLQP